MIRMPFLRLSAAGLSMALGAGVTATFLPLDAPRPAASTVAYWRFQNGVKWTAAGGTHVIADSSGNDRHGLAFGGPTFHPVELPSSNLALAFDGQDDRVFVPDDPLFHLTRSLTIEAYIRVDRYPVATLSDIVFRGDNRPGFDPFVLAISESGQLVFLVADAVNEGSVVRSPRPIPLGRLVHVAATLDDETGEQGLYVNGERVAHTKTGIRPAGELGGDGPGIGIGNIQTHSPQAFRGLIDEVRISDVALDVNQLLPPPGSGR